MKSMLRDPLTLIAALMAVVLVGEIAIAGWLR